MTVISAPTSRSASPARTPRRSHRRHAGEPARPASRDRQDTQHPTVLEIAVDPVIDRPVEPVVGPTADRAAGSTREPKAGPGSEPTAVSERTEWLLRHVTDATPPDEALVAAVVQLNLGLADGIASRYLGRGIERDDLVQVARLGLVKAVPRYRPGVGQSFPGFAAPTISGEVKRHFRDCGWMVRPPRRLQELGARLREVEKDLEQALHRRPEVEEVATVLTVDPRQVHEAREAASSFNALSLDVPAVSGYAQADGALDAADDPFAAYDTHEWLNAGLATLSDRERLVLRLRFVDGRTQSEIAEVIGVSQMQVSRILRSTLTRLRTRLAAALEPAA